MMMPLLMTLNLREDSILLNDSVLNALDHPRQVQILLHKDEKMLLLRACTVDDLQAVVVPESETAMIEISGRSLLKKIRRMVGWEDDLPRLCPGEYLPAHQAIRFSLAEARPVDIDKH